MQLYKTTHIDATIKHASWQSSQTEASKARSELKRQGLKPETATVNIPTAKGPLVEWLNANVTN